VIPILFTGEGRGLPLLTITDPKLSLVGPIQ